MFARFAIWPIALALLMVPPGLAQADDDYARKGPYAGFGYSHGFAFFSDESVPDELLDADSSSGFTAIAGYRVTPFWGVEIDLEYMNAFDLPLGTTRTLSTTLNFNLYTLARRIQPYLKFGGGFGWVQMNADIIASSSSSVGGLLTVGVGGDYYLTRNIVLNVESIYVESLGEIDGTSHLNLTVGARYRF